MNRCFLILNRALSWAIGSFGNKFCLKKRSRLIKASDNRFYIKFMQLEIGLLPYFYNINVLKWVAREGEKNEKPVVRRKMLKEDVVLNSIC